MPSSEVNVIAVMRPKQGQTQKVLDLIQEAATYVEQNEHGTLSYEINSSMRPSKDGTDTICMIERYKDKKALKEHGESAAFQKFQKGVSEQDLLLAPPTIHVLSRRGGFSSRL